MIYLNSLKNNGWRMNIIPNIIYGTITNLYHSRRKSSQLNITFNSIKYCMSGKTKLSIDRYSNERHE